MPYNGNRFRWLITLLLLALLAGYVIAGYRMVPFHGDESLLIYMSRDYYHLVQTRDLDSQRYHATPASEIDALDQELRLINGTISKLTIGLAWDMRGYTVADLNQPWYWGMADEYTWNAANGSLPSDDLLHTARLPATLFTALSVVIVGGIAGLITRRHAAAWWAALIYATTPAVLLNGRRAMMEGSFLCFSALVMLCALLLNRTTNARQRIAWAILLGVASGLAVTSKHTAGLTVALAFGAVAWVPVLTMQSNCRRRTTDHLLANGDTLVYPYQPSPMHEGGPTERRIKGGDSAHESTQSITKRPQSPSFERGEAVQRIMPIWGSLLLAGLIAVIVFLALNPAWWSDPLHVADFVLDHRRALLNNQVAGAKVTGDNHTNAGERAAVLVRESIGARAQYYEVPYWADFIGDEIAEYESGGLAGRANRWIWQIPLLIALSVGIVTLVRRWRDAAHWIALIWLSGTAAALLVLIPLDWQRYYMPLLAPVAVISGMGGAHSIIWLSRLLTRISATINPKT